MRPGFYNCERFPKLFIAILFLHLPFFFNLLSAVWFKAAPSDAANTYYVSVHGSNNASGTSDSPLRTPGYATRKLKPGDNLIIKGGRYIEEVPRKGLPDIGAYEKGAPE